MPHSEIEAMQEALDHARQRAHEAGEAVQYHKEQMVEAGQLKIRWVGVARILEEKLEEAKK